MNEQQAWAHWWARPWNHSPPDQTVRPPALCHSQHALASAALGIEPRLPVEPSPALLQLILADEPQRALMLMLVDSVLHTSHRNPLNEAHQLWCLRLAKAMPPDPLLARIDDPLHTLRAWVEPAVWQRLRLVFVRQRVIDLEQHPRLTDTHSRLGTLWQAAIWRVRPNTRNDAALPLSETNHDVMPPHD